MDKPSRNLDYLLEDDEEPKRGHGRLVVILLMVLGVGWAGWHWHEQALAWLMAEVKTTPSQQAPQSPEATTQQPSAGAATASSGPTDAGSAATPQPPASSPAPPSSSAPSVSPEPSQSASASPAPAVPNPSASTSPESSGEAANISPASTSPASPETGAAATPAPRPHPTVAPTPTGPADSIAAAERYLYGRGVPQNCDRGLKMLRPVADRSNGKAMISLGALYATGVCVPRDLPTSYRWFAAALHKDPGNAALQQNLERIWSQMTPPERQLAIKLSQ